MSSTRDGQILALGPVSCDDDNDDNDGIRHCNDGYLNFGTVSRYNNQQRNFRYEKGKIISFILVKRVLRRSIYKPFKN